jgi:hypothetical protein
VIGKFAGQRIRERLKAEITLQLQQVLAPCVIAAARA